jgi:hypothetical protein
MSAHTYSDIFGEESDANDQADDHSVHSVDDDDDDAMDDESDVHEKPKKRSKQAEQRVRLSKQQKIEAVQHFVKNPGMKHRDLNRWIENKFGKPLSAGVLSNLLKAKDSFLTEAKTETSRFTLSKKTSHQAQYPELENRLWTWFRRNEGKRAVLTGTLLAEKAK